MSLAAHLLRQAAEISAKESTRRLGIDKWRADNLSPIALSLLMQGLLRRTDTPAGAILFAARLNQYQEDLLGSQRRLSAPDIRARGRALVERILGPYCNRAIHALADLATIDPHRAADLLSMTAAAAASALSKAQRDLGLKAFELRGVLKSEAAQIDNTDAKLAQQVSAWVFRPSWLSRVRDKAQAILFGSLRPSNEQPGLRLRRPAPVESNAVAPVGAPNIVKADARYRVISGERRSEQAKADSMLARTLRSDNGTTGRQKPRVDDAYNDYAPIRLRAGAR